MNMETVEQVLLDLVELATGFIIIAVTLGGILAWWVSKTVGKQ